MAGKAVPKKDLAMMAMTYGNVYVAHVAFGAKRRADACRPSWRPRPTPGPSLIIAYSHCIAHGYDLADGARAAEAGGRVRRSGRSSASTRAASPRASRRSSSTRPRPRSARASTCTNETRFRMVEKIDPERFKHAAGTRRSEKSTQRYARLRAAGRDAVPRHRRPTAKPAGAGARNGGVTMDLSTTYLGLKLPHPLMPGASPLVDDLDTVKRLEDAGAAAIVLHSLFEEQIAREERATLSTTSRRHGESFAEALVLLPEPDDYRARARGVPRAHPQDQGARCKIPVIASLNGDDGRAAGWTTPSMIEQAGADALELNVYYLATDPDETGASVEQRTLDMLQAVKQAVKIPVAVKLSPFYSSLANFAHRARRGRRRRPGALQPLLPAGHRRREARGRCRTLAALELVRAAAAAALAGDPVRAASRPSLAATGGVHTRIDAVKAVMAGAHAVQVVSALLERRPASTCRSSSARACSLDGGARVRVARADARQHEPRSRPDPAAFERANYMQILQSWREQNVAQ